MKEVTYNIYQSNETKGTFYLFQTLRHEH